MPTEPAGSARSVSGDRVRVERLHLRFGWWALLVFLSLGLVLEALHGFKVGWYLDVSSQTRRLMWTLAHAHGTLLALVNIAFALTVSRLSRPERGLESPSRLLLASTVLLPAGFFTGGVFIHSGDPGLGVLLVPAGGVVLLLSVLLTARAVDGDQAPEAEDGGGGKTAGRHKSKKSARGSG